MKLKRMQKIISLFLLLFLTNCISSGVYVDEGSAKQFTKGETEYNEVIETLGKPTVKQINSDGKTEITYSHTRSVATPETYIPIIGALVGGANTNMTFATYVFDKDGILTEYNYSTLSNN